MAGTPNRNLNLICVRLKSHQTIGQTTANPRYSHTGRDYLNARIHRAISSRHSNYQKGTRLRGTDTLNAYQNSRMLERMISRDSFTSFETICISSLVHPLKCVRVKRHARVRRMLELLRKNFNRDGNEGYSLSVGIQEMFSYSSFYFAMVIKIQDQIFAGSISKVEFALQIQTT